MTRSLKTFGIALAMALALTALAAPSAFAFEKFLASKNVTAFKAEQTESVEFKVAGAEVICAQKEKIPGSILRGMFTPTEQTSIETSDSTLGGVEYGNCTYLGKAASFKSNHCNYRFHAQAETLDIIKNGTATEENECKEKGMVFTGVNCTITIKAEAKNEGLKNAPPPELYEPLEGPGKLESEKFFLLKPTFKGITYTSAGAGCTKAGTFATGEFLRGTLNFKGFTGTAFTTQSGLWVA